MSPKQTRFVRFGGKRADNEPEVSGKKKYGGMAMEEEYWSRFITSGSVRDYLSYREAVEHQNKQQQAVQGESYDGKHYSDRNDIVGTTYRGV